MMNLFRVELPFQDPILIFTLIVIIILLAPLVFRRFNIPGIVGMILAGVILGPNGFNVLTRDSSIILFGTVGLLYIMFLSGLEMDLEEFRKKPQRSITFGLLTFLIPQGAGTAIAFYLLNFSLLSSILLASMFASHTLLAYPILSKLGLTRTTAATITFGGTLITNILALVVLSVIVAISEGELHRMFWITFTLYSILFGIVVFYFIPKIGTWFFKNFEGEGISHYLFVLAVVFGSAFLAGVFGLEPIIGAFAAGLALNRLIPHTSALMNRIEFVGNTLFIPFFLIGTGMIVDLKVLLTDFYTVIIAVTMILTATATKWIAAFFTQKIFALSKDERNIIFGLSNAQAASTLAAVVIGYNIGLFNESILNGTILMILITCLISSFVTERAGRRLALAEKNSDPVLSETHQRIMVPIANPATIDKLMDLAFFIKSENSLEPVYPLTVVSEQDNQDIITTKLLANKRMLEQAIKHGSALESQVQLISKVDFNVASGIIRASKELIITDIVIGWNGQTSARDRIFGSILDLIVQRISSTIFVYKPTVPLNTINKIFLVVAENAEFEKGFEKWLSKVVKLSKETKTQVQFYGTGKTKAAIDKKIESKQLKKSFTFNEFETWDHFADLSSSISINDLLIVVSGRYGSISYTKHHDSIPKLMMKYFFEQSFIIIFPEISYSQNEMNSNLQIDLSRSTPFSSKTRSFIDLRKGNQ